MPNTTNNLNLFKYDPNTDASVDFDIQAALNENWDKIDNALSNNGDYFTKEETLTNTTAEKIGLGANATPDDAFKTLTDKFELPSSLVDLGGVRIIPKKVVAPYTVTATHTHVMFANGKFLMWEQKSPYNTYTSEDGFTWIPGGAFTAGMNAGVYGAGKLVFGSGAVINYSSDGLTWTNLNIGIDNGRGIGTAFAYGNEIFVSLTGGGTNTYSNTSEDGITWTTTLINTLYNTTAKSMAFGNGVFVVTGTSRSTPYVGYAAYSTDGINWTKITFDEEKTTQNIIFDGTQFIIPCNGGMLFSTDGIAWTKKL